MLKKQNRIVHHDTERPEILTFFIPVAVFAFKEIDRFKLKTTSVSTETD